MAESDSVSQPRKEEEGDNAKKRESEKTVIPTQRLQRQDEFDERRRLRWKQQGKS
jgi:hypothetical protein